MPFIRQTRDKRGFEQTYVMHNARPGSGSQRPRVLYLFRSPSNIRVGRHPLDAEVREALEHTHPDLSFDWESLSRETVVSRPEPPASRPPKAPKARPTTPAPMVPPPADDGSLLGRTLGMAAATRLRGRFAEISGRITRRARTPEERESLLARARALDPDSWLDEATIEAHRASIDGDLDALAAQLPPRRRGRRGGRHRPETSQAPAGSGQSGIMASGHESNENAAEDDGRSLDRQDRAPDAGRDAGLGPTDPASGIPDHD